MQMDSQGDGRKLKQKEVKEKEEEEEGDHLGQPVDKKVRRERGQPRKGKDK